MTSSFTPQMFVQLFWYIYKQTFNYIIESINKLFLSTAQQVMAHDQWTLLTLLVATLLINTLSCSTGNVYCVTPTPSSCSSCPHNSAHCTTLSEYAQEVKLYFTSNATMKFLPGDHTLNVNITVSDLTRLSMHGESSPRRRATVICNVSVGLSFTSIVEFEMYSLAFTSCSRKNGARNYALLLRSTWYVVLVNCSFYDNHGTALVVNNTSITFLGNNEFAHNHCESNSCVGGGGITALSSNLTFSGNTTFFENRATFYRPHMSSGGGAIYATDNTVVSITGTSNFISNLAYNGGAIYTSNNTVISFNGTCNFTSNSAYYGGGAIYASHNNILSFHGTTNFINNSAGNDGGAVYTSDNAVISFTGTVNFANNSADDNGGAIYTSESTEINFNGTNSFINNSVKDNNGGAIYTSDNTVLSFKGTNNFISNLADIDGGAIYTSHTTALSFSGTNKFISNSADYDGGAIYASDNTAVSFDGTSNFTNNSAQDSGGGVYASDNTVLSFNGTTSFISNSLTPYYGGGDGGAIYTSGNAVLIFNGTNNFINNSAMHYGDGGAIYTSDNTVLTFKGASTFINNSAYYDDGGGGAIFISDKTELSFSGTNNFSDNSASDGGAIYMSNNAVLRFNGSTNFAHNSASDYGGAICVDINSTLTFNGTAKLMNNGHNRGTLNGDISHGGGVYMGLRSTFFILHDTTVYWENNHATLGGAIYVADASPVSYCTLVATYVLQEECFFQLPSQNLSSINVQLVFKNNSADAAGSVLYGGAIDNCKLTHGLDSFSSGEVFNMIFHIEDNNTNSKISSEPFRTCPCENNHPVCNKYIGFETYTVHPGETFQVSVITVGQRNGTVPSTVRSILNIQPGKLQDYQNLQNTDSTCTKLNYTVFSLSQSVGIKLNAGSTSPCSKVNNVDDLLIYVNLNQTCPPGFSISESANSCTCEPRLARYTHQCNITDGLGQVTRVSSKNFWIGYEDELILHPHCPFHYCINYTVVFPLNNTDVQCDHNRSGLLCGRCKEGHSLVLGTSECRKCTNIYLILLIRPDGSSTGLFASCLQTDSGNRNTQWPSVLCQHHWSQP